MEFWGAIRCLSEKPNPDIYLKQRPSWQSISFLCVAFEDSDPGEYGSRFRSGAKVVQVPDLKQPSDENPCPWPHNRPDFFMEGASDGWIALKRMSITKSGLHTGTA